MFKYIKNLFSKDIIAERFPKTRGEIRQNVPLAKKTWMGVGGNAEYYFEPEDEKDLSNFIKAKPPIPMTILGGGSNIIFRDDGVLGIVIHLGKSFANISQQNDIITCGTGLLNVDLARFAQKSGLSGFEFLSGIPGTVGGAIRMNAGAYGSEIKDILQTIRLIDGNGIIQEISPQSDFFKYRKNALPEDWIFIGATFKGKYKKPDEILKTMQELKKKRETNQPMGVKTCGSTFKNPDGLRAWELIDKAGCRGLRNGDAVMSTKHSNFLINEGRATAEQVEDLGEMVRQKVLDKTGILLEWEVKRIGLRKDEK